MPREDTPEESLTSHDGVEDLQTQIVNKINSEEPLLMPTDRQLMPAEYKDIWSLVINLGNLHWTFQKSEHRLAGDLHDLKYKMNKKQVDLTLRTVASFNGLDSIVVQSDNELSRMFTHPEFKRLESLKQNNEWVHVESYGKTILHYLYDDVNKRDELLNAFQKVPTLMKKIAWAKKWYDGNYTLGQKLVSSVISEGLGFMPSFVIVFYMKSLGLLQGLCAYNEYISRDEALHAMMYIYIHNYHVKHQVPTETIHQMFIEAVQNETEFIDYLLPEALPGLSPEDVKQYIKFYADVLMTLLEVPKIYNVDNPFTFMKEQGIDGKTNQFERENTDYGNGISKNETYKSKFTVDNIHFSKGVF